jgi:hypothetical protein
LTVECFCANFSTSIKRIDLVFKLDFGGISTIRIEIRLMCLIFFSRKRRNVQPVQTQKFVVLQQSRSC